MQDRYPQSTYTPIHYGKLATAFSKEKGQWLLANVDQQVGWPQEKVLVIYRGRKVLLLPATKKYYSAAAILTQGSKVGELDNGKCFLMQFLSALAWYKPGKIDIVRWTNSTTYGELTVYLRIPLARQRGLTALFFRPTDLPDPKDVNAQRALAFFREGLSLNHQGYSFLSYYKIINMKYPNGSKQKEWIRQNISALDKMFHLKDFMSELKKSKQDPAAYIYHECRCAVAHASEHEMTYDPENPEDEIRFYKIAPIVHALAKILIENEFGIKTTRTIIREHLYELAGFRQLFGESISKRLKAGETLFRRDIKIECKISLRLWNKKKFKAFENLIATVKQVKNGIVLIELTRDGRVIIPMRLDFPNENLIFEPMEVAQISDDNTANAASQFADACRFYGEMIADGVLEVWDINSDVILGRLREYMPVNVLPAQTRDNFIELERKWREESKIRRQNKITASKKIKDVR